MIICVDAMTENYFKIILQLQIYFWNKLCRECQIIVIMHSWTPVLCTFWTLFIGNDLRSEVNNHYLPKRPAEDAKPTDIELDTVGESVSKSLSKAPVKLRSSRLSSSRALPRIKLFYK